MGRLIELQERNGEAQDARTARAIAEGPDYTWTKNPLGWTVVTKSGACYLVTERGECSCEDYRRNCCGKEVRCKHATALRFKLAAETCPAPVRKGMTDAEVERFDRLFS